VPQEFPHIFETVVFDRELGAEGSIVSIPHASLRTIDLSPEDLIAEPLAYEILGVRLGVPVPTPDDIAEVFFASLAGRVVPFDDFSFERWRDQRLSYPDPRMATFATSFATSEFAAVEESPLNGASLVDLVGRGTAWTVAGGQALTDHPFRGLGVLIIGEFGLALASVTRAFHEELYLASRYRFRDHLRRLFNVPSDWEP
jgi:hypothetical protein